MDRAATSLDKLILAEFQLAKTPRQLSDEPDTSSTKYWLSHLSHLRNVALFHHMGPWDGKQNFLSASSNFCIKNNDSWTYFSFQGSVALDDKTLTTFLILTYFARSLISFMTISGSRLMHNPANFLVMLLS